VHVSIKQMHKNSAVICKEVRIVPKHIFVNNTGQLLTVRQEGETNTKIFEPNERQILDYRQSKNRRAIFKLQDSEESSPILTENLGIINFYVLQKGSKVFMKVEI
jgi:hypothetical protein